VPDGAVIFQRVIRRRQAMAKMIKHSLIVAAALGVIALGAIVSSGAAMAQDTPANDAAKQVGPGQPAENPGSRYQTMEEFDRWKQKNPETREELRKDPSLLNNPDYVAKHPELQKFMDEHPNFKRAAKKNPERLMHKSYNVKHQAKERHRKASEPQKPQ
jgi:hypothetical protein